MTSVDRRRFLRLGAGAAAAAAAGPVFLEAIRPSSARAAGAPAGVAPPASTLAGGPEPGTAAERADLGLPPETGLRSGFHRFPLGEMEVTVLNDGQFTFPVEIFAPDVDPAERESYSASRYLPTDAIPLQVCPVLVDTGSKRALVDAGRGTADLWASFRAAGVERGSVDVVVVTHAHPDHLGGLVDPDTGALRFPEAEVVVSGVELDFWTDPDVLALLSDWEMFPEGVEGFVVFIKDTLEALDERIRTVGAGKEIVAGLHALESAGHTPGHICVLAESGGEQLLLTGDAITNIHMAFEHPDWRPLFDYDGEEAIRTRQRLLERAASDELLVQGFHFPFPGLGRVARESGAYRWVPEARA